MSAVGWLVLGGVVWLVVSVGVAVVIGRAAVRRDRQKPVVPQRCESLLPPRGLRESLRHPAAGPPKNGDQR